MHEDK